LTLTLFLKLEHKQRFTKWRLRLITLWTKLSVLLWIDMRYTLHFLNSAQQPPWGQGKVGVVARGDRYGQVGV